MTRRATAVHEQPGTDAGVVASTIQVGRQAADSRFMPALSIDNIFESPQNPRKHFDPAALQELEQSIREKGVLTPVLVRPVPGWSVTPETIRPRQYELAAGHRRFRAAKAAGLDALPAVAREMTDAELLEVLVIENDQREDVHPLEEAAGYQALMRTAKYDVARIAARIGRSAKYVYDRVKLLQLIPKAQELFLEGKFTAGHAVLLARLKPADQKRAIDPENTGNAYRVGGLFAEEHAELPLEDEPKSDPKDSHAGLKAVSVRELQAWIQDRVRVEPGHLDGFLFPETKALLEARQGDKLKPILITHGYMASDDVRHAGKDRVYGQNAWKRADGNERSKTCDWSRVGFVACDEGQGQAFMVCINKDKCTVHWADRVRAKKQRQKAAAEAVSKGEDPRAAEEKKRKEQERVRAQEKARMETALPLIRAALFEKVKSAPVKVLADELIEGLEDYCCCRSKDLEKKVPRGKTAEDLLRHLAAMCLHSHLETLWEPSVEEVSEIAKPFGVDARKILDQAAPAPKVQTSAKGEPGTCRKCGCTEDAACQGGCGWVDKARTKCSSCFPPKLAKKR